MNEADLDIYRKAQASIFKVLQNSSHATLPDPLSLTRSAEKLHKSLPEKGYGLQRTSDHLLEDLLPGLNGSSLSPTYFGFVTGGITPAARLADSVVTLYDQNVAVHLPRESIATIVEDYALRMLLELVEFDPQQWPARTLTTGATASNVIGLACGREFITSERLARVGAVPRTGEGLLSRCLRGGIEKFQVLTTLPHSCLGKAANIVGLGSEAVIDVSKDEHFLEFDMQKLEDHLRTPKTATIVVISCGEVNTGAFATKSIQEVRAIRSLCDRYGAWLHVDAAFGLFARVLPATSQYAVMRNGTAGLELADSIASDGHKLLNVPYDCGIFLCRHREIPGAVFQNTNAAYLSSSVVDSIVSPLNVRIENSARFRGLPVYATLAAYGQVGYASMIARMVDLARKISSFIDSECPHLELLPRGAHTGNMDTVYICVLFRERDNDANELLTQKIKASRKLYVSGTEWEGRPAVRVAVAKWDVDVARDFAVVKEVLKAVATST